MALYRKFQGFLMLYFIVFFIVLIIFLLIIVFFVFKKSKPEPSETVPQTKTSAGVTLDSLINTLKSEKKELSKIEEALEKMAKGFPFPENENEASEYFKFVYYYAKNPLTSAKMIVEMQKKLTLKNPKYAKQIEEYQMRGIDARSK